VKDTTTRVYVLALCCLYFVLGAVFVPLAGIQNDEALFSIPIYQHSYEFGVHVAHHVIPLMVMSYIGTLKTAIYWMLFHLVAPSVWSVRLPVLLLGAITIFLFYCLASRIANPKAAFVAALLLATDQTFLLTNTFDWGPVAIEHFLLVTSCLLFVKFASSGKYWQLAGAFLVLGLGLWNKAIFLWALTGLTAAALSVLWPEIRNCLRWKAVGIALVCFLSGALPFLIYNVERKNATLRENVTLEVPNWKAKMLQVQNALEGQSMLGYLVLEDDADRPKQPLTPLARAAFRVHHTFGERRAGILAYAAAGCLLLVPLWWRSRAARFALVFCPVTWLMMAITKDAGGAPHHVVLLWPFPQLLVGITLAAIPWRPATALLAAAIACSNLLVWNEHLYKFARNGTGQTFTDAIGPLSEKLGEMYSSGHTTMIYITDWGMWNTLAMMHQGRLPIVGVDDLFPANPMPDGERDEMLRKIFTNRGAIFVGHVAGQEVFAGLRERIERTAETAGLGKQVVELVPDSNGRPMFEIFRLIPR